MVRLRYRRGTGNAFVHVSGAGFEFTTRRGTSDIFSLGLVAYFLLTGLTPFRRDTIENTIAARLSDAVPPLLDVCPAADVDLNGVIMRCLERDPTARFSDIDQLANALAQC